MHTSQNLKALKIAYENEKHLYHIWGCLHNFGLTFLTVHLLTADEMVVGPIVTWKISKLFILDLQIIACSTPQLHNERKKSVALSSSNKNDNDNHHHHHVIQEMTAEHKPPTLSAFINLRLSSPSRRSTSWGACLR